jgi:hypothetical protein
MTTNKISQSTTQFPLLRALSAAPNGALAADEATAATLADMGGDANVPAHRTAVANGKWDLKARGCVADPARGTWAITDLGRDALASGTLPPQDRDKYLGQPVARGSRTNSPTPAVTPDPTATMARAEEPAAAPVAEEPAPAPAKRRLKVANAPAPVTPVDVPAWLSDDEIRAMVVENSECFGAWSARSNECGRCSLAGWCRNAKASTLALLASKLSTETPANPGAVSPAVAKLDGAVGAANAPDASRTAPPTDGRLTMKARHDNVCAVTGRPIKVGDAVKYAPGVGMYHASETLPADAVAK